MEEELEIINEKLDKLSDTCYSMKWGLYITVIGIGIIIAIIL